MSVAFVVLGNRETLLIGGPAIRKPGRNMVVSHDSPPCTYYRHMYRQEGMYRISHNTPCMYWSLCFLFAMLLSSLFLSAIFGLRMSNTAAIYCVVTFACILLLHMFIFEPIKVFFLTTFYVRYHYKLPWCSRDVACIWIYFGAFSPSVFVHDDAKRVSASLHIMDAGARSCKDCPHPI